MVSEVGYELKIGVDMCEDGWILLIPIKTDKSFQAYMHAFVWWSAQGQTWWKNAHRSQWKCGQTLSIISSSFKCMLSKMTL